MISLRISFTPRSLRESEGVGIMFFGRGFFLQQLIIESWQLFGSCFLMPLRFLGRSIFWSTKNPLSQPVAAWCQEVFCCLRINQGSKFGSAYFFHADCKCRNFISLFQGCIDYIYIYYIHIYIYVLYIHIVILYMLFPSAHLQSPAQVSFVCIAFFSRKSVAIFFLPTATNPPIRISGLLG